MLRTNTHTHMHSCIHSCALLQQCTVAISPPLASSPLCDCYWKCSAATGASSWRIYMTQVHALESTRVCVCVLVHTSGGTRVDQPAKTRSNVSHLMSTPLTSHNTLQTYAHTHSHMCLNCLELYANQAQSITQLLSLPPPG